MTAKIGTGDAGDAGGSPILNTDLSALEARVVAWHENEGEKIASHAVKLADYLTASIETAMGRPLPPKSKKPAKSRIVQTEVRGGRVWELHATKGWRSRRCR